MEAVINEVVAPEDLEKFEQKYKAECEKGSVSRNTEFEFAWCLIRTKNTEQIKQGIKILEGLVQKGNKDEQRDYLFYLSVGNYKLKEYVQALKFVRMLLKNEPGNTQALDLEKLINDTMKRDGLIGMAIVAGIGLAVAGLAGLIGFVVAKKAA